MGDTIVTDRPERRRILFAARIAALAAFVALTNFGFLQRVELLLDQHRWVTLIGFFGVWALSMVAFLVAAFQGNAIARCGWAIVIALTTAAGFAYRHASGSEFGVLDGISLWNLRDSVGRATAFFYMSSVCWFAFVAVCGFAVMAVPPVPRHEKLRRWLARLVWMPAVPIAAIVAIVLAKQGGGAEMLPAQFAPLSIGLVAVEKAATIPSPRRKEVAWTSYGPLGAAAPRGTSPPPSTQVAHAAKIRHIVMLIDESIRGDYIDWTVGNPYTPELASLKDRIVNFGPAVSGGNCSVYSNALLRFDAARTDLGPKLLTNPTVWQYAKKAGFRTTYIDAQAAFYRNLGKLQDFMTEQETRDIDNFDALDNTIAPSALDDRLLDEILNEIRSDRPVFIYANKNGAHFPYDMNYPKSARVFQPSMSQVTNDSSESRINSMRNAIKWSVDRFFRRLFDEADLKDTLIIYTSDHGQNFDPHRLTHCTVEGPDPREGLVPLFVVTGNDELRARLATAAEASRGHASHFSIVPTVLEMMGYAHDDIAKMYGESLLEKNTRPTAFTSGDIFGLFAKVRWHPLDLGKDYLEPTALTKPTENTSARIGTRDAAVAR